VGESDSDRDDLEQAFFAGAQAKLARQLGRGTERERERDALREVVQIDDRAFLDRLVSLGVRPETALAMRLIPLVVVSWADGQLDERERQAIEDSARKTGLAAEKIAQSLLKEWLARPPDPQLLERWKGYVGRLWGRFTSEERWKMRENLLGSARAVAEAAGGILGLGSKISAAERRALDDLARILD